MIWSLLAGLLMFGSLAERVRAQEEVPPPGPSKGLVVPLNQSKDLQLSTKKVIKTVLNANENVVRAVIKAEDPKTVLVTGLLPGVAKVTLIVRATGTAIMMPTIPKTVPPARKQIRGS